MSDEQRINELASQIDTFIRVILNPTSAPNDRVIAQQACENFQWNAPPMDVFKVSMILMFKVVEAGPAISGCHFLEVLVKYKWSELLEVEREYIKENLLKYISTELVTRDSSYLQHLEEPLAKVFGEILKKEWPQLWPNVWAVLFPMFDKNNMPLLIFRRLVEDVVVYQNVDSSKRRRDLYQSLGAVGSVLLNTIFDRLNHSYPLIADPYHKRRCKISLDFLLSCIEFVSLSVFMTYLDKGSNRVTLLCNLLQEKELRNDVINCLVQLLEKKSNTKLEERIEIQKHCLNFVNIDYLVQSVNACPVLSDDDSETYLSKVGDYITLLASSEVFSLNHSEILKDFDTTSYLIILAGCINAFGSRPELVSSVKSANALSVLLKRLLEYKTKKQDDSISLKAREYIVSLIQKYMNILSKNKKPNDPQRPLYSKLKSELTIILKTYVQLDTSIYGLIQSKVRSSVASLIIESEHNLSLWETLSFTVDSVTMHLNENDMEVIKVGITDLEFVLKRFMREINFEIKSHLLSLVSALFAFVHLLGKSPDINVISIQNQLVKILLEQLFNCFNFDESHAIANGCPGAHVKDLRRHSAALLIKLCVRYPKMFALYFNEIQATLKARMNTLSPFEYSSFVDALILMTNQWAEDSSKRSFIEEVLKPKEEWDIILKATQDPPTLYKLAFSIDEHEFFRTRSVFLRKFNTVASILKRTNKTAFPAIHPGFTSIRSCLFAVLQTIKTIHSLADYPNLKYVFEPSENEKMQIMGLVNNQDVSNYPESADNSVPERAKTFIQTIQELCYMILGTACTLFEPYYHKIPQVTFAYLNYVGCNMQNLNDFKIRPIIRTVFKPLLCSCSIEDTSEVIIPFMRIFSEFMCERLINNWNKLIAKESEDNNKNEGEEILFSSCLRLLTKEYIDLVIKLLEKTFIRNYGIGSNMASGNVDSQNKEQIDDDVMIVEADDDCEDIQQHSNSSNNNLGEVGKLLIEDSNCLRYIIQTALEALCWTDSVTSLRASQIIILLWKDKISNQPEIFRMIFAKSLMGLCLWYGTEGAFDTLVKIQDMIFVEKHSEDFALCNLMLQWGAPQEDVQKLLELSKDKKAFKKRKEIIRRLTESNPRCNSTNQKQTQSWLTGLPELNIMTEKRRKRLFNDEDAQFQLEDFFSFVSS